MTAEDVTEAPWAVVVGIDHVCVVVDDDDVQPTVCDIPATERGRQRPLVERVEVAERIVADHRAGRQRRSGESFHTSPRGVDVVATPW